MNSKVKGKRGELQAVKALNAILGCQSRRGQQRSGVDAADIIDGIPGTHPEVKLRKSIAALAFLRQSEADAPTGEIPYVLMRENEDTRWVVMLRLECLREFAECVLRIKR